VRQKGLFTLPPVPRFQLDFLLKRNRFVIAPWSLGSQWSLQQMPN